MKNLVLPAFAAVLLLVAGGWLEVRAQGSQGELGAAVLSMEAEFWQAYSACETAAIGRFFDHDVEFYHDRGGMTQGAEALAESIRTGVCGGDARLRREAVEDSVRVDLLREQDAVYGAVVQGEHRFYVREGEGQEALDGQARFVNLWLLQDGAWKMSRVFSYAHGPAPYVNQREMITLSAGELDVFAGSYEAPNNGTMLVARAEGGLVLSAKSGGMPPLRLYPESDHVFFVMERDLTFEFVREGETMGMRVRERGEVVEEAMRR